MMRFTASAVVLCWMLTACTDDPTDSQEYRDLEQQLAEVTSERDALSAARGAGPTERYEKSLANQEAVEDILNDPESYGSEEEVIDLLATYATEDAVMDDAVFGDVGIESAWRQTLYGGAMDAEIDNYYRWLSDDGSQGGVLWMWHGTNLAGNPFELPGISLNEYEENGLLTYQYVAYPFPDEYVNDAILGDGTG